MFLYSRQWYFATHQNTIVLRHDDSYYALSRKSCYFYIVIDIMRMRLSIVDLFFLNWYIIYRVVTFRISNYDSRYVIVTQWLLKHLIYFRIRHFCEFCFFLNRCRVNFNRSLHRKFKIKLLFCLFRWIVF